MARQTSKPRVVISNATRLHAHRHAYALQKAGLPQAFIKSVWHKPGEFPYRIAPRLPGALGRHVRSFLDKRSHPELDPDRVIQVWPGAAAAGAIDVVAGSRHSLIGQFAQYEIFDRAVARLLQKQEFDIFVGFEMCSRRSIEIAKRRGAMVVIVLAAVHRAFSDSRGTHHVGRREQPCAA